MSISNPDAAKAAEYRDLERRLRADADTCRQQADEVNIHVAPSGDVLSDYQRDVARHWRAMADTAEFHADEAATRAGHYEQHALAGAA